MEGRSKTTHFYSSEVTTVPFVSRFLYSLSEIFYTNINVYTFIHVHMNNTLYIQRGSTKSV